MRIAHLLFATAIGLQAHAITTSAAERAIDKEVVVAATVDDVWDAWTTRAGIVGFLSLIHI